MNGDDFMHVAQRSTGTLDMDVAATLRGVYRRRRRRRVVVIARSLTVMAIVGVGAMAMVSAVSESPSETQVAADGDTTRLSPYAVSAVSAEPVVTVSGISLTYLPPSIEPEFSTEENPTAAGERYVYANLTGTCGEADACEDSLGVTVTRAEGLTLERYLQTHWFGDSVDTTVNGEPAKANKVVADEASGIVWSPAMGVVVELHVNSDLAPELRKVVNGVRVE